MKIATIVIHNRPTENQKNELIQNPNGELIVDFIDELNNKSTQVNYAQLFRNGGVDVQTATYGVATFNAGEYYLDKDLTTVLIEKIDNVFKIKTTEVQNVSNENQETFDDFNIRLIVTINNGNLINPLTNKEFNINVNGDIPAEIKTELQTVNLELVGDKWNDFTINGKAKVEFQEVETSTVFVGNKVEGFLTN